MQQRPSHFRSDIGDGERRQLTLCLHRLLFDPLSGIVNDDLVPARWTGIARTAALYYL
jgi:hypothetical protein